MSCAKMDEPIEMQFGTRVGWVREHVLHGNVDASMGRGTSGGVF